MNPKDVPPFTFHVDIPPGELVAVIFDLLTTAAWSHYRAVLEREQMNGLRLTKDHRRELVLGCFRSMLKVLKVDNPFRANLEEYIEKSVIPMVDAEPAPPSLKLV